MLITGASSGIGRACAVRFAHEGASLILSGRRRDALEETAARAGNGQVVEADLADSGELDRFCDQISTEMPPLDVLVLNAGIGLYAPAFDTDRESARQLLNVNFLAPVEMVRRLAPSMAAGGTIVTVGSMVGKVALPGMAVYSATKYALGAFADALRIELRGRGIHVLHVCPGYVRTAFASNLLQGDPNRVFEWLDPMGITPERLARALVNGVRRGKRTLVVPRSNWFAVALARLFPRAVDAVMGRVSKKLGSR